MTMIRRLIWMPKSFKEKILYLGLLFVIPNLYHYSWQALQLALVYGGRDAFRFVTILAMALIFTWIAICRKGFFD